MCSAGSHIKQQYAFHTTRAALLAELSSFKSLRRGFNSASIHARSFRFPAITDSRHGYPLPHGRRPQQRPPSHQERYGSQTQPSTRASDQTQQVRPGHDPRGLRLRSVREESHGAAEGVQGQEGAEVHQEEDWNSHPGQEKERGAEQRPGRHEEGRRQEGVKCCSIKLSFCSSTKIQTPVPFVLLFYLFCFLDLRAALSKNNTCFTSTLISG